MPQLPQKKCLAVLVLNWYSFNASLPLITLIPDSGTDAAIAPLLRHKEQSQRRMSISPSGRSSSISTEPQWHVALCFGFTLMPLTSVRLIVIPESLCVMG